MKSGTKLPTCVHWHTQIHTRADTHPDPNPHPRPNPHPTNLWMTSFSRGASSTPTTWASVCVGRQSNNRWELPPVVHQNKPSKINTTACSRKDCSSIAYHSVSRNLSLMYALQRGRQQTNRRHVRTWGGGNGDQEPIKRS